MSLERVSVIVAVLLAILAAFASIPNVAIAFVILGLVAGWVIAKEDHVRVLVTALVLAAASDALGSLPAIGEHLTAIIGNVGAVVAAAAIAIIAKNVWARIMP